MKASWGAGVLAAALVFAVEQTAAGDAAPLTGRILRFEEFPLAPIPTGVPMAETLTYLEYPEGASEVRAMSFVGADAASGLLIVAPHSELLCGTGGCPYVLLDRQTGKSLGDLFGAPVILDQMVDGYPVLQVLSRRDAGYTGLSTYVHGGGRYVLVSHALLDGGSMDDWRRALAGANGPDVKPVPDESPTLSKH